MPSVLPCELVRLRGERCAFTLLGERRYSEGCWVETWTRKALELWKERWQCLHHALSHLRGVAFEVGAHFTWRLCSHRASLGDLRRGIVFL